VSGDEDYYFLVVVFLVVVVEEAAGVVLAVVVSIFMPVSIAAGAGAIAGAVVSDVAVSSFFEVHAARAKMAATRARRFIYDLLERQTWVKSPVRARDRGARFWRGRKSISSESSVKSTAVWLPYDTRTRLTRK
jgi:MFS superfamily sulfate permease-like transporter